MALSYFTALPHRSWSIFRRPLRAWFYGFLGTLSFLIFYTIYIERKDFLSYTLSEIGSEMTSHEQVLIIGPGDLGSPPREVRPEDDNSPVAHEPGGLGTLRDVREEKFYRGGTLTLENENGPSHQRPMVFDPYPDYNSNGWRKKFTGNYVACQGPRGNTLNRWNPEDVMTVYPGVPKGFPPSLIGSYSAIRIEASICTNRYSRLTAYGYEGNNSQGNFGIWKPLRTDWDHVRWGRLQSQCNEKNADRYSRDMTDIHNVHSLPLNPPAHSGRIPRSQSSDSPAGPQYKERSAVILRAWHDMEWTENHKQYVRSLIMELSLHSGGEYTVLILCHVRDKTISLDRENVDAIQRLKAQFVPSEFVDMTIMFDDETLESWYPEISDHSTTTQYWQPIQILAQTLEGFDYYWQLEMDSRFTGHVYHFLEQAVQFAKEQPRKYLWERNSYFYIPGSHGTWPQFKSMVETAMKGRDSIWGPKDLSRIIPNTAMTDTGFQMDPIGPSPPTASPEDDQFEWGVGEESDLITFLPTFDPAHTRWVFTDTLQNVSEEAPRQASPVAMGRISKQLAREMHNMQSHLGIAVASEMTAPTLALWHGLKAVHVPHPIYADGKWTSKELGRIMNQGAVDKINGGEDSIWNWNHRWDHILYRLSYMFSAQFPEDLYRRWMGFEIDPSQYTDGSFHQDPQGRNWFETGDLREDLYGPLCFPSMLLHPVKNPSKTKGSGMAVPV